MGDDCGVKLSYCVVNTNGREHLRACIDAIRSHDPTGIESEILVLDNRSDDGSQELLAELAAGDEHFAVIEPERRQGKAANDTLLLQSARGEFALLLNEDTELRAGAASALLAAL